MSLLHQPHDLLFKDSLKEKPIAVAFLKAHLPAELYQKLNFNTLQLTDKSLLTPEMQEIHCDVVYRCHIDGKDGYLPILFLLEHFSTAPRHIAFRLLQYCVNLMNDALKAGSQKLPIVLPLCIYHGEQSPFPQSTDIYDDFEDPDLARALVFKPFSLIDLTTLPESMIRQHGVATLMELLLKHSREKEFARAVAQLKEGDTLTFTLTRTTEPYLQTVVKYALSSAWSENQASNVLEVFYEALPDKRETIMSAAQQLIDSGIQQGMQASHAEALAFGERKARLEDAREMRAAQLDLDLIKRITKLSDEDLAELE